MALRDAMIIEDARRNVPRRDIARNHGITEARVSQIVTGAADADGDLRAWLLEGYHGDLAVIQEVKEGKGRPITSGNGKHVINEDTGEYAYDPSPRIDAVRTAAVVRKNIAMLMGNEKPPPKQDEGVIPGLKDMVDGLRAAAEENRLLKEQVAQLQALLMDVENSVPADVVEE
jgi:hypothetical protein